MECVRRLDLPHDPQGVGIARLFVRKCCREWGLQDPDGTMPLVVSELVTNALLHAQGPVTLFVAHRPTSVVLSVTDGSDMTTRPRQAAQLDTSGRGLELVAALSEDWGEQQLEGGKRVWAEVAGVSAS